MLLPSFDQLSGMIDVFPIRLSDRRVVVELILPDRDRRQRWRNAYPGDQKVQTNPSDE